ncbi:MAG: tRNA (adenosine(37)-N6)-dimethylallyltransferase MiaA [Burkholderiaceae bacterium]
MTATRAPLLCLMGPTASGKSAAAMALAQHLAIEIVSVDSALVYREMDIGTAKPGEADRAAVTHHLIDLIDPAESYSAARFVADVDAAIADIRARGRVPLLVGGTMLYFKALREGLDDMPASNLAIRADIECEAAADGWAAMHRKLAKVDPRTAARLAPLDAQRISRALEVWRSSGQTLAGLQHGPASREHVARSFVSIALEPSDRSELHARIATRFDAMLAAGLIDEVARLRARGDLNDRMPSMRCVGYRQVWEFLEGRVDRSAMRERAIAATRQLAKRQVTWLRSTPDRTVIDSLAEDAIAQVVKIALNSGLQSDGR